MILLVLEFNLPLTWRCIILLLILVQLQRLPRIINLYQACGPSVDPLPMLIVLRLMTNTIMSHAVLINITEKNNTKNPV